LYFYHDFFRTDYAGWLTGFVADNSGTRAKLYGGIAIGLLVSAGILATLTPKIKKLMGKVH
jgi:hypothetical protein